MSDSRRATVYLDPEIHRALKLKAAVSDRSISEMVNEAVRLALAEDAEDLAAFDDRVAEPDVDFGSFVRSLRRRGRI
jgi:predicted transcriptional regulator